MPTAERVGLRRVVGLLVVALLLGGAVSTAAATAGTAQAQNTPQEAFVVQLQTDGSATVTVTDTFDLTTTERSTFRELERNESRTDALRASFTQRLRGVSTAAATDTDRSMAIENATVSVATDGDTGSVSVSATWRGLAATDGERLVLSAPFDDGFATDRAFVVRAPDGYALSATEPAPDSTANQSATWAADADLDGFSAVATPASQTGTPTVTGSSGPGFGVVATLLALSALVAVRLRARRR